MLHFQKIVLIVLIAIFVFACQRKEDTGKVKISVKLIKGKDTKVELVTNNLLSMDTILLASAKADTAGRALIEIALDKPIFANIQTDNQCIKLFLTPGDVIDIEPGKRKVSRPSSKRFKRIFTRMQEPGFTKKRSTRVLPDGKLGPGKPATDVTGLTTDGKKVSLSSLKGKVVYVDVWATWCAPCRAEFPDSKKLVKEFEGNDQVEFCMRRSTETAMPGKRS
jgi:hypothetical protein